MIPPGVFPRFLADQFVAQNRHFQKMTMEDVKVTSQSLEMRFRDRSMHLWLQPDTKSILVQCSDVGLLKDACCGAERAISQVSPGLAFDTYVHFDYKKEQGSL